MEANVLVVCCSDGPARAYTHRHTHTPPEIPRLQNLPDLPSNWTWGEGREWVGVAAGGVEGGGGINVTFFFLREIPKTQWGGLVSLDLLTKELQFSRNNWTVPDFLQ